jgi:hypothetical protein
MKKVWLTISAVLSLSALACLLNGALNPEENDIMSSPDMGVVIPYYNPRQSCNFRTVGLISRWIGSPYSTYALLCNTDEHGYYFWTELHDVEP